MRRGIASCSLTPFIVLTQLWTQLFPAPACLASEPVPMPTAHRSWCKTPVDHFVLARLQQEQLAPSAQADRRTLIRRATLDLTGLLPDEKDVDAFVSDRSVQAWAKVVERLLASPRYGERWAQHWLDVVRYADSDGFEYDDPRPHAWRYRDWVIDAFNQDKSFARFVREQIAGDELYPGNRNALTATGLQALGPLRLNAGLQDEAKNRQEVLTEMTDMIGAAFLGLTIGCARCHDHKFEEFTQQDYYQLQAFFAATKATDMPLGSANARQAYERSFAAWEKDLATIKSKIDAAEKVAPAKRDALVAERATIQARKPAPLPSITAATDQLSPAPATFVLNRGVPGDKLHKVAPGFPEMLAAEPADGRSPTLPDAAAGRRRSALADWLASPDHPLTARVFVNRIWQHLIGQGIVTTPNDFGVMGHDPTHPALLKWLAVELQRGGIKQVQRQILLSATYQQSSQASRPGLERDRNNDLLWRMNRRRMEAEMLRDTILQLSGALNEQAGGPGIRLPLHPEIARLQYKGTWKASQDTSQYGRRTIYVFLKRNNRVPFLEIFDAPSTMVSCGQRSKSSHAGQALAMLNGEFLQRHAQRFSERIQNEAGHGTSVEGRVTKAFRLALSRPPTKQELAHSLSFLDSHASQLAAESGRSAASAEHYARAWDDFALVLMNLDEFAFVQ